MKKTMLRTLTACLAAFAILSATGCEFLMSKGTSVGGSDSNRTQASPSQTTAKSSQTTAAQPKTYRVTVHYYGNITRSYTVKEGEPTPAEMLAESGNYIVGLYDGNNVRYADESCVLEPSVPSGLPADLYAKYETYGGSYSKKNQTYDENPKSVDIISPATAVFDLNNAVPEERALISACKCNPYADVTITFSFQYKVGENPYRAVLEAYIQIGDEKVETLKKVDKNQNYPVCQLAAHVKAKQLTDNSFQVKCSASGTDGFGGVYLAKNLAIRYDITF